MECRSCGSRFQAGDRVCLTCGALRGSVGTTDPRPTPLAAPALLAPVWSATAGASGAPVEPRLSVPVTSADEPVVVGRDVAALGGPVDAIEYLEVGGGGLPAGTDPREDAGEPGEPLEVAVGRSIRPRRRLVAGLAGAAMVVAVIVGVSAVRTHAGRPATISEFFGPDRLPSAVTASPKEKWRYSPPEGVVPVSIDHTGDVVVVTTHPAADDSGDTVDLVVALDAHDGRTLWSHELPPGTFRVAAAGGLVLHRVVSGSDVALTAFDARTGRTRWSVPVEEGAQPYAVGAAADHVLVVDSGQGLDQTATVRSLRLRDGRATWSVEGSVFAFTPGAVAVSRGRALRMIDDVSGVERWHLEGSGATPIDFLGLTDGLVLAGQRGEVVALDAANGSVHWTKRFGRDGPGRLPVQLGSGAVAISEGNVVLALDPASGDERWRSASEADWLYAIEAARGERLLALGPEVLQSIDPATGHVVASLAVTNERVAFTSTTVYALTDDGALVNAPLDTLTPSWHLSLGTVRGNVSLMSIERAIVVLDDAGDVRVYG